MRQPFLDPERLLEVAQKPLAEQRKELREMLPSGFYCSVDRASGIRRLHSMVCYRTPFVDYSPWEYLGARPPAEAHYDVICRACFKLAEGEAFVGPVGETLESDEEFTSDESEGSAADAGAGQDVDLVRLG